MGRSFYSAERNMEQRVRRIEEEVRQFERREDRKVQNITVPVNLWLDSGLEEGGILIIQPEPNVRGRLTNALRRRRYKVQTVEGGQQAVSALRKASYSLIIVHWGIFQRSSDLVGLLRKALSSATAMFSGVTSPQQWVEPA